MNTTTNTAAANTTDVAAQIASTIAETEAALTEAEYHQGRFAGVLLGQGFVIQNEGGITLTFDVDAARNVTNPRNAKPWNARRFTRQDAEHIASKVTNGNGKHGTAVHVSDAIRGYIESTREVLQWMREAQARRMAKAA